MNIWDSNTERAGRSKTSIGSASIACLKMKDVKPDGDPFHIIRHEVQQIGIHVEFLAGGSPSPGGEILIVSLHRIKQRRQSFPAAP